MKRSYEKSRKHYEEIMELIPSGVSSNSRVRNPHPLYFKKANGAELFDLDDNRYIDLIMGNGAVILGHGDPRINKTVTSAIDNGLSIGVEWEKIGEVASKFLNMVQSADMVRFTNTGSEATLHSLQISRYATGKNEIAKPEGSYHGWVDDVFVSAFHEPEEAGSKENIRPLPATQGLDKKAVGSVRVFPFNDINRTRQVIEKNKNDLAAVILEPVMIDAGYIPADREYLEAVRDVCTKNNILLIFDEVLTSFRISPGGAQEYYNVTPDLAIYGKAMANGYPLAAVAGKKKYMKMTEPQKGPTFVGTFNGHVVPAAAANATLSILNDNPVQEILESKLDHLKKSFSKSAQSHRIAAKLVGGGGHFHWYFTDSEVVDYRTAKKSNEDKYSVFAQSLFDQGILVSGNAISHHALSLSHDEKILEELNKAFDRGLREVSRKV